MIEKIVHGISSTVGKTLANNDILLAKLATRHIDCPLKRASIYTERLSKAVNTNRNISSVFTKIGEKGAITANTVAPLTSALSFAPFTGNWGAVVDGLLPHVFDSIKVGSTKYNQTYEKYLRAAAIKGNSLVTLAA